MKKFLIIIFSVLLSGILIMQIPKNTVMAEDKTENIDDIVDISEDTVFSNMDFEITATNLTVVFEITSGIVRFENCKISATTTTVFDAIFNVGETAKLVLTDVAFENVNYNKCIINNGIVDIARTTFIDGRTSVENNSSKVNSLNYYSGNLETVNLKQGYISVYENTVVEDHVNVAIETFANRSLAVKSVGTNVFASKYIDKFIYKDNNKTTVNDEYYLDYIGDGAVVKDASGNVDLQAGDIVLTTMDLSFEDRNTEETINYAPMYCTSYNYLKTSETLYYSNLLGRALDNYTANTDGSVKFINKSAGIDGAGNLVLATISCWDENNNIISSSSITYLSGSNHAVFVEIPDGYEYGYTGALGEDGSAAYVFSVSENLYANSCYMRPIIQYNNTDTAYESHNISINFYFKKKVKMATVSLTENYGVELVTTEQVAVGSTGNFLLTCADDEVITSVKFNGEEVTVTKVDGGYSFSAIAEENNIIDTEIKHILNVTPNPGNLSFQYGDEIELKETYVVSKTGETIELEYVVPSVEVGRYSITEIKTQSKDNYIINVVGDVKYTVGKKQVDLSTIATKVYRVGYTEDIELDYVDFLVNTLPDYLTAELQEYSSFVGGIQQLRMYFSVKSSEKYIIVNENDYITVTLDIVPMEINVANFVLNSDSKEYTGSKIELLATGYDSSAVQVRSLYYLPEDLTTPVDPISVGIYTVKLEVTANSSVYTVVGSKTATLTITAKNIDLTNYLTAVELTEFSYDGQEKYIDLKEDLLPDNVVVSVDSTEKHKDANIYYYNLLFSTTSNNYTCIETYQVSLIINPKIVTISLATSVFNYTGNIPNLVVVVSGVVGDDSVTAVFESAPVATVGTHNITVLRLNNTNYAIASVVELEYTINSISVNMTGVEFKNIDVVYDGQKHLPVLTGTLPLGIAYSIDESQNCTTAGTYTVGCVFTSSNEGIVAPATMYATVTIAKKELLVVYTEPLNMIANGEKKNISIELVGIVDGDTVPYEITYSADPILAGEYTCRVKILDETNYVLKTDTPYRFMVFMSSINYHEDGVSLSVQGKFSSSENLTVSKVNNKIEIVNLLSDLDVKDYLAINLSCVNYSDELMTISIDGKSLVDELKYFKLYRVKDNKLESVDFTTDGNIISFMSNCNEEIILVEEHTFYYIHRTLINSIIIAAIASLVLVTVIVIVAKTAKKKNK